MRNSLSFGFSRLMLMYSRSSSWRVSEILRLRAAPCFAVVGFISLWSRSRSFTFRLHSSIGLSPHSRLIISFSRIFLPAWAISIWSVSCVGILTLWLSFLYFGFCHSSLL